MNLGDFIAIKIQDQGISPTAFADKIGMHKGTLHKVLHGKSSPTLKTLQKIAQGLGVDVRVLRGYPVELQEEAVTVDDLTSCEIPRIVGIQGMRGVDFCETICAEFVFQEECKSFLCSPQDDDFERCPRNGECPCSVYATPRRWRAFLAWIYAEFSPQYPKWKEEAEIRMRRANDLA